jgi:hypothetical protein
MVMNGINRIVPHAARLALGAALTVFGLNGFFHFIPLGEYPPDAAAFLGALGATGYMFPLIKGTEVVVGVLLLANRFVPLALTLVAPVLVNIVAFHLALAPAGSGLGLALLALELYLAWSYRSAFRSILAPREEAEHAQTGARRLSPSAG